MTQPGLLRVTAALLLVATVVFVVGVRAERSLAGEAGEVRSAERSAVAPIAEPAQEEAESHEEGEAGESQERHTDEPTVPHDEASETGETIAGIDPESTGAVAAAVALSLALVVALWFSGTPIMLAAVALFALLFAALDLREAAHQFGEARSGLAAIALLAATLHLAVAVLVGLAFHPSHAETA